MPWDRYGSSRVEVTGVADQTQTRRGSWALVIGGRYKHGHTNTNDDNAHGAGGRLRKQLSDRKSCAFHNRKVSSACTFRS